MFQILMRMSVRVLIWRRRIKLQQFMGNLKQTCEVSMISYIFHSFVQFGPLYCNC